MLSKYLSAGLIGSALLTSVAFAQTPAPTADRGGMAPAAMSDSSSYQGTWRASKIVGLSIYNDNNESIGSINDLLTDSSGNIKAVVLGVGGFLGIGEHLVAVSFDKVKFVREPVVHSVANAAPTGTTAPSPSTTTTGAASPAAAPTAAKPNPWYPDHAVLNATKDELKAMPEFKYST